MSPERARRPIVYLGPSLPRREAAAILPACDLRRPVRRGDLYREREAGGSVFVLIDGVFFQELAVPPREIVDVIEDGALLIGAASLGALRAAECWPAGMRGVGSIYRLFRRGSLGSDDEVAVVFDPEHGDRPLSVALINIRYALSRAVRAGRLERDEAERLTEAATSLYYAERTWPAVLAATGGHPRDLRAYLEALDLKRLDATRALRRLAGWLAEEPALGCRPRRGRGPLGDPERDRERGHDALAGARPEEVRLALARWLLVSGRCHRYLAAVGLASSGRPMEERLRDKAVAASVLAGAEPAGRDAGGPEPARLRAAALRLVLFDLWREATADEGELAERIWAELEIEGELDAELFRWRAIREAAARARELDLAADATARHLAEREIAGEHGYDTWEELRRAAGDGPYPWAAFADYRAELALARALRDRLFNPERGPWAPGAS